MTWYSRGCAEKSDAVPKPVTNQKLQRKRKKAVQKQESREREYTIKIRGFSGVPVNLLSLKTFLWLK
ncbi:hypothetical protein LWI29_011048 [Acer saccharum]|uniref:Uncharacterized protein n=1 Tax=Acer saccharum TaxID=4024 RepID=A0AA39SCY1_ACESA|nr:hypothetical protein LWI29_011048 [Acer saccharum]KAK1566781.1 hypothetical protein Q3G72_004147 [Acer saccharum]